MGLLYPARRSLTMRITDAVVIHSNSCSALPLLSSSAAAPCRVAHLLTNTCYARISLRTWFHASGSSKLAVASWPRKLDCFSVRSLAC
ncbi:hypothetical protein PAHAL_5G179100 [Panicum hallii]|uniref:Uncharacterized protein n=1 Tax=Panicum hallii TaxID=206008 RepID=A0A2T8IKA4_9POAL|nr:hypothetical protein PAHAL_5G179100 [Panicum hallii]